MPSLGPKPNAPRVRVSLGAGRFVFGRLVHVNQDGIATVRLPKSAGLHKYASYNEGTKQVDGKTLQAPDQEVRVKHHKGVKGNG